MNGIAVSSFKLSAISYSGDLTISKSITSGIFRRRPTERFLLLPDSAGRADVLVLQLLTVPAGRG